MRDFVNDPSFLESNKYSNNKRILTNSFTAKPNARECLPDIYIVTLDLTSENQSVEVYLVRHTDDLFGPFRGFLVKFNKTDEIEVCEVWL